MSDGRISIIVPTLNEKDALPALLQDLQCCRQHGDEVILVDGGSSDATREIAGPLTDRQVETGPGRARQMNAGARAAQHEILWFLHADTRVAEGAREQLLEAIDNGADWGRFDVRLSGSQPALRLIETLMNLRSCLTGIATGDQGLFVRQARFTAARGFPEIALMEDITLSKTLKRSSRPHCIRYPRLVTSSRRWETNGIVRTVLMMWRLRLAYWLGTSPDELAGRYR
jgi:rSAM/selenodomain-associated transferase 2